MERERGDGFGSSPESHPYRHSRGPPRSSDAQTKPQRRSPNTYRSGGGGGSHNHRPFDSPPRFPPIEGGGGRGFRPVGGRGGGGFDSNYQIPLSGQKREHPFSGRGGSPDRFDGGKTSFAKLFVGSVPRTATEEEIRPLFEEQGQVLEVALIKDKRTGQQQGCCFIKYATSEEADRAIRSLHNQRTLPGGVGPIQVRYADGERERLGAVEYKLFVGSLNKQASEKDVEEIFSPYGRVEDVYLMRDEMRQSRGCGFVKFFRREMAMAAINALNGLYTMKGCEQPLIVRFADPKRPRAGESRGNPAFGGPGFGPRFQTPADRPTPNFGDPIRGHIPSNSWNPPNLGPSSNSVIQGFGSQLLPRSGDMSMQSTQSVNQTLLQDPTSGQQQIAPLQKPLQSPQDLPSSIQLHPHTPSYSQIQTSLASLQQLGQLQIPQSAGQLQIPHSAGQLQIPHSAGQAPFNQALPSKQLLGLDGQLSVSQPQVQQNAFSAQHAPSNSNLQPYHLSAGANQQQLSASIQPQLLQQPFQQSPSQFAQMLSQQQQTLQASFQSSQQAFSQLQQQFQLMQPSNQNLTPQQNSQATKQQWAGIVPQIAASTPATASVADVPAVTTAAPVLPVIPQAVAPAKCNWTEHSSPDGFKYYYNDSTGQSTWEKPEELTLFEQQQQQQQQSVQHPQTQSIPQSLLHQVPPTQQVQLQTQFNHPRQLQQSSFPSSYQASGVTGHQNFQGLQAAQDWMWKNKPSGS